MIGESLSLSLSLAPALSTRAAFSSIHLNLQQTRAIKALKKPWPSAMGDGKSGARMSRDFKQKMSATIMRYIKPISEPSENLIMSKFQFCFSNLSTLLLLLLLRAVSAAKEMVLMLWPKCTKDYLIK
jgi:hypothetical protein